MKIIKLKEGDVVPKGAVYLSTKEESNVSYSTREEPGFLFSSYVTYKYTSIEIYHYYEVKDEGASLEATGDDEGGTIDS